MAMQEDNGPVQSQIPYCSPCNHASTSQPNSFQIASGGAWNFAARFLLSAAAGDPQVMSDDV